MASSSALGQLISVDVTGACASTDTITLTYKGTSAVVMAASDVTVLTDDVSGGGGSGPIGILPTITVADTTKPTVTSATLDYNTGALVVTFSETIDASATVASGFHLNDATGADDVTLSAAPADVDATTLTFTLTEAQRVAAIAISNTAGGDAIDAVVLDVDALAVTDMATNTNLVDDANVVTETADTTKPTVTSATLDYNTGALVVTFSETIDASATVASGFHINNVSETNSVNLTVAPTDTDATTLSFTLTEAQRVAAIAISGTAGGDAGAVVLDVDALAVTDMATNTNLVDLNNTVTETADTTAPTITAIEVQDTDFDGIIETIALTFSEPILTASAGANGFDVTSAANHGTCTAESITPNSTTSRNLTVTCTSAYTAVGDMNVVLTANAGMRDIALNQIATVTLTSASSPAITDAADPVLMSTSPASAGTSVATDADVILTFSEPMNTTFAEGTEFAQTPDATTWSSVASSSNKVITLSHSNDFNCNTSYTMVLDEAEIASAAAEALLTTGPEDGTWSFTIRSCGGSGSGGGGSSTVTSTTAVITLSNPDDGDSLDGGEDVTVTWSTSGSGHDTISLAYSTNAGLTYSEIAYNVDEDDGSYAWTVPDIDATDAILKITSYDSGKGTLDTDTVTIDIVASSASNEEADAGTTTEGAEWSDNDEHYNAPGSGEYGASPFDGSEQEISEVSAGWFIRTNGSSSVYYVDENHERFVFWDTNTFFTWSDSWDDIVWVTDATLPTLTLGDVMLPQPGVTLVKIQSDPKVYAIDVDSDGNYLLRWIPTEEIAITLYGESWADYVIDLDSTVFSKFETGEDMSESDDVDTSIMKTRVELAELAQ